MSIQKIRIKLKSYDHSLIDQVVQRLVDTATKAGCKISGPIPLPTEKEIVTVIRSPHKYKDSREQFESRVHKRVIDVYATSSKVIEGLLKKVSLPAGVEVDIKL